MSFKPEVSIIMSCYNDDKYISRCIDSILKQSFVNFEFLIVDDCSSDHSLAIINKYKDSRIKVFKNDKNMGRAFSLNELIKLAEGEFIMIMDADDIVHIEKIKIQYEFLTQNPLIDLVSTNLYYFNQDKLLGKSNLNLPNKISLKNLLFSSVPLAHATVMARSIWYKKNLYTIPEIKNAEDQDLWLKSFDLSNFYILKQNLYLYRLHKGSIKNKIDKRLGYHIALKNYLIRKNLNYLIIIHFIITLIYISIDFIKTFLKVPALKLKKLNNNDYKLFKQILNLNYE